MHRSHKTTNLQGYFDEKDSRVRELPYTLDAQILNLGAVQIEDAELRFNREIDSRLLATTPVLLDNRGVYYAARLAPDFTIADDATELASVQGTIGGVSYTLQPLDDRFPVPAGVILDPNRETIPLEDPVLFTITGSGDATNRVWDVKYVSNTAVLPLANRLTFWMEGSGPNPLTLDIHIEGEKSPRPAWANQRSKASETIISTREGISTSIWAWEAIDRITVRGLPASATLTCWTMPFNTPAVIDETRPFYHAAFRDQPFPRYWQISVAENLLKELYQRDNLSGLEYAQSYAMSQSLGCLAIEPGTCGMFAASGSQLFYVDRREALPARPEVTGLTQAPLFGLDVSYDPIRSGAVRYITIRPVPYAGAAGVSSYRYLIEDPAGNLNALLPDGSCAAYSGSAGWRRGAPITTSLPLALMGTYVITLECIDAAGAIVHDSFPYPNLTANPAAAFDLFSIVPQIRGLAFDGREQLWAWTGDYAVPLLPVYRGYVLDPASRTIYLTETYDQVAYE